jgi:hypothetical protein
MKFSVVIKKDEEKIEKAKKKIKFLGGKNIQENKEEISIYSEENIILTFDATKEFDLSQVDF